MSITNVNDYIKFKVIKYGHYNFINDDMWEQYQEDFVDFTEATFKACDRIALYNLRTLLRNQGVQVNKQVTIIQSLYDILCKEDQTEWTKEEILDHINTNGFFAAFNLNRISGLIGLEIYINLLLPKGIVGLLLYIILKKELDKTLKEETIKTLDKDKTQVDSRN